MMLDQMRRAAERLVGIDSGLAEITRGTETVKARCRVSYQSGGVWNYANADAGANITTTPYVLAKHNADIREGDLLAWRGRKFQVGAVSFPTLGGGDACLQAQLREVRN
jgi:hypothetical protein